MSLSKDFLDSINEDSKELAKVAGAVHPDVLKDAETSLTDIMMHLNSQANKQKFETVGMKFLPQGGVLWNFIYKPDGKKYALVVDEISSAKKNPVIKSMLGN